MKLGRKVYDFMAIGLTTLLMFACQKLEPPITTGTLLDEMADLNRLTRIAEPMYRTVQFSSYDRRSIMPSETGWFANEDGFGNEPVPGFAKVIQTPDERGIGEYLICDIQNPGAIVRLWTAGIKGKIRLFLDDMNTPVFEGNAEDFFWHTPDALLAQETETEAFITFRQFDAVYFPIPFAKACRMEWIGDIRELHFYHVGVRLYDPGTRVVTFKASEMIQNALRLKEIQSALNPGKADLTSEMGYTGLPEIRVPSASTLELFKLEGTRAIDYFSLKIGADHVETALRSVVLSIYFDHASIPQVQAPLGDFFGSAPGISPYQSLAFSVEEDSSMVCRFVMPFKQQVRMEIENTSGEDISISGGIRTKDYAWEEKKSMHLRARWRMEHHITASSINDPGSEFSDFIYLKAKGQGRLVGAASFIYNPSNVPTSWGNWWGEGDEKIFVDQDTFPSFFGTGSEDYYNYSWSDSRLFYYPYCGQPRNDGPGNRGYASNFRWHILDDIPFREKLAFYMELAHHGEVPGFSYGRIVYFYALPDLTDDYQNIAVTDIRQIAYLPWSPEAYLGSAGFRFIQAEHLMDESPGLRAERGNFWAEGALMVWSPATKGENLRFQIRTDRSSDEARIGFTLLRGPEGGTMIIQVNGNPVKFRGNDTLDLQEPGRWVLDNYLSEPIRLQRGIHEVTLESADPGNGRKIGIDFVWIKEP
ncbi:MAG: glycoside hydrolase family 172 protein [Bacteroidales bacterium]